MSYEQINNAQEVKYSVLYVDHSGHAAPLSLSYHATASRELSSSLPLIPASTITEIDTAYCPQCYHYASYASIMNTFMTTSSVNDKVKGTCPNASCRLCPVCKSPLNVSYIKINNSMTAVYSCSYCRWTSNECHVQVPVRTKNIRHEEKDMKNIALDLADAIETQMDILEQNTAADESFKHLMDQWNKKSQERDRLRLYGHGHSAYSKTTNTYHSKSITNMSLENDSMQGEWSIQTLEHSRKLNVDQIQSNILANIWEDGNPPQSKLKGKLTKKSSSFPSSVQIIDQGIQQASPITNNQQILPLRIPLKPKISRRCKSQIKQGKPGILIKPKANPLEGDTSLRSSHGQWWKKDSSAIHIMPKVQITYHASSSSSHALLLRITNPTLSSVNVRFNLSSSSTSEENELEDAVLDTKYTTKSFLIDPINKLSIQAKNIPTTYSISTPTTTPMISLDPVEDAFLELGKGKIEIPAIVKDWNGVKALDLWQESKDDNTKSDSDSYNIQLLAQEKDIAWVQLLLHDPLFSDDLTEDDAPNTKENFYATSIALEIEVGNGSWESSFIKPKTDVEMDLVSFPLYLVWKN